MVIQREAYARAGLAGNPSDGYYGRTVSTVVRDYHATATIGPADEVRLDSASSEDPLRFTNLSQLAAHVESNGYTADHRLAVATLKRFHDHVRSKTKRPVDGRFSVRYESNIPYQVGLGGSSAIVTAILRALLDFHRIEIRKPLLPTVVLEVETCELGLSAGLQDRVVQVYGGCVYMDFERRHFDQEGHGLYEPIDPACLPPLFVAHRRHA